MIHLPLSPARRPRRGVTLIEVVIAIFVLSVGILGIMSLFPAGYRLTRKSVERSVSALAARHALARVVGEAHKAGFTYPEVDANLLESQRTGTIYDVKTDKLGCKVLLNEDPAWGTDLVKDYYLVMTSGTAEGHVYRISGNSKQEVTEGGEEAQYVAFHDNVKFRTTTDLGDEPVRKGDNFAIIGNKGTGADDFPNGFLTAGGSNRTIPVATYGDPNTPKEQWRYTYGCIISSPSPEMRETCRLDIFVYRGFAPNNSASLAEANQLLIGHFVAYLSGSQADLGGT